ncbi:MAG: hypothetical protein KAT28_00345 [Candidatus Aenigmarchaeota archaeon]|nr:hypothetical protein [Candidatus Aenigmarchaeota archaeon]
MKIKKMTGDMFNILDKSIQMLSPIEKKIIKEKIKQINSKYNSLIELKKTKTSTHEIDPMFFCFEDLPPTGKEYWFMKFVSTKPKDKRQLLAMFGDSSGTLKVNQKEVKCIKGKGIRNGYMNAWSYDNKKDLILEGEGSISINHEGIMAFDKQNKINYKGKFPNYSLNLSKKNKEIVNLKMTKPKDKSDYFGFSTYFKSFAGYSLIDLYFDFTGMLNKKKFSGKCYVQKVVVIGPFIPWRWGRIVFSNGSILTYFEIKVQISKFKHKFQSMFEFYDSAKNKKYVFKDLNIKKFGKKNPRWIITANKGKIFVSLKSYSSHKFVFEKLGSFSYLEYLCEVTDLLIEDCDIDMSKLGSGFGLVEDTNGYVL